MSWTPATTLLLFRHACWPASASSHAPLNLLESAHHSCSDRLWLFIERTYCGRLSEPVLYSTAGWEHTVVMIRERVLNKDPKEAGGPAVQPGQDMLHCSLHTYTNMLSFWLIAFSSQSITESADVATKMGPLRELLKKCQATACHLGMILVSTLITTSLVNLVGWSVAFAAILQPFVNWNCEKGTIYCYWQTGLYGVWQMEHILGLG